VVPLSNIPPLRERKEDIHFWRQSSGEAIWRRMSAQSREEISRRSYRRLLEYMCQGMFGELEKRAGAEHCVVHLQVLEASQIRLDVWRVGLTNGKKAAEFDTFLPERQSLH